MMWLVGPAGVGKSAIMQTIAEQEAKTSTIVAAIFFSSSNARNDPSKVIATLAYQIALQHRIYRRYIQSKTEADPMLWTKTIISQFSEFIVKPFVNGQVPQSSCDPILILIDGLDECSGEREQILLLSLISYFTIRCPRAPFLWVIASRPESHIKNHLARKKFASSFEKLEISIDSNEACQDVERFLNMEFQRIKAANPVLLLKRRWPPEHLFLKIITAASGLFAYAATIIRFIGDSSSSEPVARLQLVIDLIDGEFRCRTNSQPMAHLDALYRYIITQIPSSDLPRTREFLSAMVLEHPEVIRFRMKNRMTFFCDWIGWAPNDLYGALRRLHAVVDVPSPRDAFDHPIRPYHQSFADFLLNPERSGAFFLGTQDEELDKDKQRANGILRDISQRRTAVGDTASGLSEKYVNLSWWYESETDVDVMMRDRARTDLYVAAIVISTNNVHVY
ncbi:hypothetical protein NP233_g8918 [Leucocoprinus birnbaumii]|uniref:NACHT domain-containing protein n=1 Tax=Leucocoprinus birnbaumii TaxID=56174 RepID=A0AAD5VLF0_9AGAR|nr:hypothetical protein NP233_g8918 [Leucocoprinus birnbaumii]